MRNGFDTVEEFWTSQNIQQAKNLAGSNSLGDYTSEFANFLGLKHKNLWLMPSGHQGLEWLLKIKRNARNVVLVPVFNCSVVEDGIRAAGCQPQLYDFSPGPGVFNWDRLIEQINPSVGALIVTHYFGVPTDFRPVIEYCRCHGITIIEDCAHTLGGAIDHQQAGTLGDASIFSFNYDKPISLGWGGLAVINSPAAFDINQIPEYRVPSIDLEMSLLGDFVVSMAVRRKMIPRQNTLVMRILRRAHLIRSGRFLKDAQISVGAAQAELGRWCLSQYQSVVERRNANACSVANSISLPSWPVGASVKPAWVKQKIFIKDEKKMALTKSQCQKSGFRVGNFNWPNLIGGVTQSDFPIASEVATKWVDIPVHQNLDAKSLDEMLKLLKQVNT